MFETLFVAAVLGAGGPPAPPPAPPATLSPDTETAFAETHVQVALATPAPANKDELIALARARFDRVLTQHPTHKPALLGVARMYSRLGDRGAASAAFARLLTAHPTDAAAHHEAALSHARFGDWAAAAGRCESAVRLDPTSRQYGTTLGFCLARAGRWDDAHAALVRVMPADEARENLAVVREHVARLAVVKVPVAPVPVVVAPAPREVFELTAAYRLRNVAAADVADALLRGLGTDREVGIRQEQNELVVTGSPASHARVAEFVSALDRPAPSVVVQGLVAEVPASFLTDCGLTEPAGGCVVLTPRETALLLTAFRFYPGREVLTRPQIQVRDNHTGYVRVGQDAPTESGLTLRVTPQVMPNGVVQLRSEFELREAVPHPVVVRAGVGTPTFPINVVSLQTTVQVPPGGTVVVAVPKTGADGKPVTSLLVLTPTVVRP